MLQFTKNVLLVSAILLCPLGVQADRVFCDEKHEFLCPSEHKCISKNRLCNFVEDCIDGADEAHCGECEFSIQAPEECGLSLKPDRVFAWYRKEPIFGESTDPVFYGANEPLYYIKLDLNSTMRQYISRHRNQLNLIHKPKIIFPHLGPTNNDKCQAVIKMRITEYGSALLEEDSISGGGPYWPEVSLLIVEPREHVNSSSEGLVGGRENRKYRSMNLQVKRNSAFKRGYWLTYRVLLGSHRTIWTLELIVEATIKSSLVHISSIKYDECGPIGEDYYQEPEAFTDVPLESSIACNRNQFRCELSGLCIDKSLICDFGHDCGENDNSDEEFCDDYLGRCDFEDDSLCDWSMLADESWIHMSAKDEDQAFYGKTLARPTVEHTFQSGTLGGRYLLLNVTQLRMFTMHSLIGPHVTLQPEARECSFRFWSNTPAILANKSITTPHLTISRVHLSAKEIFTGGADGQRSSNGWQRHEILLLKRSNIEEANIFSLMLSFGNFGPDLVQFLEFSGFLALDDFSFTPGCHLVYHGPAVESACGDNQFFCRVPTLATGAQCIPMINYCDFKNDCGLGGSLVADDELDCPHACLFRDLKSSSSSLRCLALDVRDGRSKRLNGAYKLDDSVNEAFNWTLKVNEPAGKLLVEAQSEKFLARRHEDEMLDLSGEDKEAQEKGKKIERTMSNLEIYLPNFSGAHANCSFEITYQWARETENVFASIRLESEGHSTRAELKKLLPDEMSKSGPQTVRFGIGHQQYPFKLLLNVYYADHLIALQPHKGSLSIYSYRFLECAFFSGLIDSDNQVQFIPTEDDFDDDEMTAMDYLDYQSERLSDSSCLAGYFQCHSPILCIPEEFVCDMQLDCQGGGADERHCTRDSKHWLQFDFDHDQDDSPELAAGWSNDPSAKIAWHTTNGALLYDRNVYGTGPPYDHTLSDYKGKYLATRGRNETIGPSASLHSPRFLVSAQCKRLVFHIYFWGNQLNKFQVLRHDYYYTADQSEDVETILYELKSDRSQLSSIDAWRRVSLELAGDGESSTTTRGGSAQAQEFSLIFRAFSGSGPSDLIALDDISFGPLCVRNTTDNKQGQQQEANDQPWAITEPVEAAVDGGNKPEPAAGSGSGVLATRWVKVGVIILVVTMLVMVSISCQVKNMLQLHTTWTGYNGQERNQIPTSGCMMEFSLEDFGNERGSGISITNSTDEPDTHQNQL